MSSISASGDHIYTPLRALETHAERVQVHSLSDLLDSHSTSAQQRAKALAFTFGNLHIDFSKQRLTTETVGLLKEC